LIHMNPEGPKQCNQTGPNASTFAKDNERKMLKNQVFSGRASRWCKTSEVWKVTGEKKCRKKELQFDGGEKGGLAGLGPGN